MAASTSVAIEALAGGQVHQALEALARLRIEVFRDWPYLYDGSLEYERDYLAELAKATDAIIVVARDGGEIVGAATGAPLAGHTPQFVPLFNAKGLDAERVFYCGESVLLPAYRGRGIGHAFFDHREAHALGLGGARGSYSHVAFCGVVRSAGDPRAPRDFRPLDDFWRKRGYSPVDGLLGSYSWKEIGETEETAKPMQFWMRAL